MINMQYAIAEVACSYTFWVCSTPKSMGLPQVLEPPDAIVYHHFPYQKIHRLKYISHVFRHNSTPDSCLIYLG